MLEFVSIHGPWNFCQIGVFDHPICCLLDNKRLIGAPGRQRTVEAPVERRHRCRPVASLGCVHWHIARVIGDLAEMPRRQLIIAGVRCHSAWLSQRAAAQAAIATRKLHATAAHHKWYLPSIYTKKGTPKGTGSKATQSSSSNSAQQAVSPSFAASAFGAGPAASAANRCGPGLLRSAAPRSSTSASPSFAATPIWGSHATQAAPPAAVRLPTGTPLPTVPHDVPQAGRGDPLYCFAKLGEAPGIAADGRKTATAEADANALLRFSSLGSKAAPAAKKVASKLSDAAALLRFAKMGK